MTDYIPIDSIDDPRLDPYRALRTASAARDADLFVTEGRWLAIRLLQSGYAVHSVLVEERRRNDLAAHLPPDTRVYVIPDKAAPGLVGFDFHRGVLACGRRPVPSAVDQLLGGAESTVVVCCRLQDPENLGLIFRNCAAFGADAVILGPACADPLSRRVLRVSMGNVFWTRFAVADDLEQAIRAMRQLGFDVAGAVLAADAEPLMDSRRRSRQALVFGEEAHGITPSCLAECTRRVTIPMSNQTDSLNVAVASGVFLYHFLRSPPHCLAPDDSA